MSDEEQTLLTIRGVIAGLTNEQQEQVKAVADYLRRQVKTSGPIGDLALALVGAEAACA